MSIINNNYFFPTHGSTMGEVTMGVCYIAHMKDAIPIEVLKKIK